MTAPIDQFWLSGWASSGTTGTIAASQSAQSGAVAAIERYVVTAAVAQSVQTGALAGTEATVATVAGMQAGQTGAIAGTMRIVVVGAPAQSPQTGAVAAIERTLVAVAEAQSAQFGAIVAAQSEVATAPVGGPGYSLAFAPRRRAQRQQSPLWLVPPILPERIQDPLPSVAAMVTAQPTQRGSLAAFTSDDDLVLLLAA